MRPRPLRLPHAVLLACGLSAFAPAAFAEVFINELHYDNAGADTGEAIEIIATAGENLSGYRVWLYNGSNTPNAAKQYGNHAVPAPQSRNCGANVAIATVTFPRDGYRAKPPHVPVRSTAEAPHPPAKSQI